MASIEIVVRKIAIDAETPVSPIAEADMEVTAIVKKTDAADSDASSDESYWAAESGQDTP